MSRLVQRRLLWIPITVVGLLTAACSSTVRPVPQMSPAEIEDKAFQLEPAYIVSVNVPSEAA